MIFHNDRNTMDVESLWMKCMISNEWMEKKMTFEYQKVPAPAKDVWTSLIINDEIKKMTLS